MDAAGAQAGAGPLAGRAAASAHAATLPATPSATPRIRPHGERLEADVAVALDAVGGQDAHGGHGRRPIDGPVAPR